MEDGENAARCEAAAEGSDKCWVFTVLNEDVQSLRVSVFSSDRQRSHPMTISGTDSSSVPEEKHQNICTAHLM